MIKTKTTIKRFIKAKTAEDLEQMMLVTNQSLGSSFDFEDIQFVKGFWYAWFYADISVIKALDMLKKPLLKQDKKSEIKKAKV